MLDREKYDWWNSEGNELAQILFAHLRFLDMDQGYRLERDKRHLKLYSNQEYNSLFGVQANMINTGSTPRVTFNLVQSAIDTIVSKLTKNSPKITFLTEEGDWTLQEKAENLTKFIQGLFHNMEIYRKAMKVVKDACITGTGGLKFFIENGNVKCEHILTPELIVDDMDGYYGNPTTMYQVKFSDQGDG